jgi:hypothetical protein
LITVNCTKKLTICARSHKRWASKIHSSRHHDSPKLRQSNWRSRIVQEGKSMRKVMMHKIAFIVAAIAIGSAALSADALARGGGHGGGGHSLGGHSLGGGFGSAGEFGGGLNAPSLMPIAPNTPLGRDVDGLNFNNQLRNGATGASRRMRSQPQPGTINGQLGEGTELGTMNGQRSIDSQLGTMNGQPGTVTLP